MGEEPHVLEHAGAVLALEILHHHEEVLLALKVLFSTNTCSTWNLKIKYCDFWCAQMIHHIPDIFIGFVFDCSWLSCSSYAPEAGVKAGEGVGVQCVEQNVKGQVQG